MSLEKAKYMHEKIEGTIYDTYGVELGIDNTNYILGYLGNTMWYTMSS